MRTIIFSLLFISVYALSGRVQAKTSSKTKNVYELLKVVGVSTTGKLMYEEIISQLKKAAPSAPASFWKSVKKDANYRQLEKRFADVYIKHMSAADIKGLIKFYKSPLGKRFIKVQPQMTKETLIAGQTWGRELAGKIYKRLRTEGYISPPTKPTPKK